MRQYASFVQAEVKIPFRAYPGPGHAHLFQGGHSYYPVHLSIHPSIYPSIHRSVYMREFDSLAEN